MSIVSFANANTDLSPVPVSPQDPLPVKATAADGSNATLGTTTGAAVVTDAPGTIQQYLRGLVKLIANFINTTFASDYPLGAVPVTGKSGIVANASAAATLTAVAGKTTYITGFEVTGAGATAGLPVSVTVTGLLGGTLTYSYCAAVGALVANQPLVVQFSQPLPASAPNTNIVVTCPALGAGNTQNCVVAHGYNL